MPGHVADQLERVVQVDEAGAQRGDLRDAAGMSFEAWSRNRSMWSGRIGGRGGRPEPDASLSTVLDAALLDRNFRLVVVAAVACLKKSIASG